MLDFCSVCGVFVSELLLPFLGYSSCPFILATVLSVLFRFTDSDYPFGIFKLFSQRTPSQTTRTTVVSDLFKQFGNLTITLI
jgi:hypothetical protein